MKSSVAFTTSGSALGRGNPVAEDEFASLMISDAGSLASDAIVYVVDGTPYTSTEPSEPTTMTSVPAAQVYGERGVGKDKREKMYL